MGKKVLGWFEEVCEPRVVKEMPAGTPKKTLVWPGVLSLGEFTVEKQEAREESVKHSTDRKKFDQSRIRGGIPPKVDQEKNRPILKEQSASRKSFGFNPSTNILTNHMDFWAIKLCQP